MPASNESDAIMAQMLKNLQDAYREIGRLEQLCRLSEAVIPDMSNSIRKDERKRIMEALKSERPNGDFIHIDSIIEIVQGEASAAH
jgi:hypothetical protein